MPSNISLHLASLGYVVTLLAIIGWSLVRWEAQLAAEAGRAPVPAPVHVPVTVAAAQEGSIP